jgi:hypothetical protein
MLTGSEAIIIAGNVATAVISFMAGVIWSKL